MRELSGSLNLAYFLRLLTSLVLLRLTCLHADLTTNFQNMFLGNLTLGPAMWMLFRFPGVGSLFTYIFPSFSLLNRCLQKLENDKTLALLIAPVWPTQVWWPRLLSLLVANPLLLPQDKDLLTLPQSETLHPLRNQMRLMACLLLGNTIKTRGVLKSAVGLLDHGILARRYHM